MSCVVHFTGTMVDIDASIDDIRKANNSIGNESQLPKMDGGIVYFKPGAIVAIETFEEE